MLISYEGKNCGTKVGTQEQTKKGKTLNTKPANKNDHLLS